MSYVAEWDAKHAERPMWLNEPLPEVAEFFTRVGPSYTTDEYQPKVLDIGCGAGTNTIWLAKQAYRVWGFDSSMSAINRLIDKALDEKVLRLLSGITMADCTKPWPYSADAFDLAFEVRVFENLTEEEALAAYIQLGRVLKTGGRFFCLTACSHRSDKYTTCGTVRHTGVPQMEGFMKKAGLHIERIEHIHGHIGDLCVEAIKT